MSDFCFDDGVYIFGICESWLNFSILDSTRLYSRSDSPGGIKMLGVCICAVNSVRIGSVVKGFQKSFRAVSVLE